MSIKIVGIFYPFEGKNREVQIPKLFQETAQGGLIRELAHEQGSILLLPENGYFAKPMEQGGMHRAPDPDAILVRKNMVILCHQPVPS